MLIVSELDIAITQLDMEVSSFGFPKEDTVEWWLLRAKATGLSLLRAMQAKGLTSLEADTFRKGVRVGMMKSDVAYVIEVAQVAVAVPAVATP